MQGLDKEAGRELLGCTGSQDSMEPQDPAGEMLNLTGMDQQMNCWKVIQVGGISSVDGAETLQMARSSLPAGSFTQTTWWQVGGA